MSRRSPQWVPGIALGRGDGYTLVEACLAIEPGWESLARRSWGLCTAAGVRVRQVTERLGGLALRVGEGPEVERDGALLWDALGALAEESRVTCVECGATARVLVDSSSAHHAAIHGREFFPRTLCPTCSARFHGLSGVGRELGDGAFTVSNRSSSMAPTPLPVADDAWPAPEGVLLGWLDGEIRQAIANAGAEPRLAAAVLRWASDEQLVSAKTDVASVRVCLRSSWPALRVTAAARLHCVLNDLGRGRPLEG